MTCFVLQGHIYEFKLFAVTGINIYIYIYIYIYYYFFITNIHFYSKYFDTTRKYYIHYKNVV